MIATTTQAQAVMDLAERSAALAADNCALLMLDNSYRGEAARAERAQLVQVVYAAAAVIDHHNGTEGFENAAQIDADFWGAIDALPCSPAFYGIARAAGSYVPGAAA